jgi:predicted RNase H-like HicB family nuclease
MLTEYLNAALKKAEYKKIDDGTWYADIPDFTGVWANADSVEGCRSELREVLEEWLVLKIRDEDLIPTINGFGIHIKQEAA